MIFNLHHLISVLRDNHLPTGDRNQIEITQKKIRNRNISRINVSHVLCETSFVLIYLLFSNLILYRQRISLFFLSLSLFVSCSVCLFDFGHLQSSFRLIVFFSFSLTVVVIDVVLYFSLSLSLVRSHMQVKLLRLFVDFINVVVIICMWHHRRNYRLLSTL